MWWFVQVNGGEASSNAEKVRARRVRLRVNLPSKLLKVATVRYSLWKKAKSTYDDNFAELQQVSFLQSVVRVGELLSAGEHCRAKLLKMLQR
jgi:hypothetical protein